MGKTVIGKLAMKIVVVNGFPGCGKTTFENICQEILGPYCQSRSTVDKIKELAIAGGWDGDKTPRARKFLSDLKDLFTEFNDMPVNDIKLHAQRFEFELSQYGVGDQRAVFFVDSREPAELSRFRHEMNAIIILVRRDMEPLEISNHADADVEHFGYDYVIDNNGTIDDLREKAVEFLNLIFS